MSMSHQPHARLQATERARREGGYILAMFGLLLVPLLLMAGLAVDVGSWYNRASDIQKAADAASLAGVVWLPDEAKARTVALDVAKRNGFDNANPNITVTVSPSTKSPRRLNVTIEDNRVGSFFWGNLGGRNITLSRGSYAEYVTPVPLGSPRNFFGLGTLLVNHPVTDMPAEYLYQSVNPYCTDKVNGDRYQSKSNGATCGGPEKDNAEYRAKGYEMYIEAKPDRGDDIEVRLYDARYDQDAYKTKVPGPQSCTTTYETTWEYPSDNSGWTVAGSNNTQITITGPLQYQYQATKNGNWQGPFTLDDGETFKYRRDRLRTRGKVQVQTPNGETCVDTEVDYTEGGPDEMRGDNKGTDDYTFTLYAADNTPLNDDDNPQICEKTFRHGDPAKADTDAIKYGFDGYSYLGSRRWNTLCTISSTGPSGKYILRVHNSGAKSTPLNDGSNQWGLVAKYSSVAGDALCDGRNDVKCPRVYGKDAISVKAASVAKEASFYLAEIGPEHSGKKLKIDLFDPGEGGQTLEIQKPTGSNSWESVPITWTSVGASPSSGSGSSIDVTANRFNGKLLQITVDLTLYNPPADNNWWQIKYTFTGNVTDRTTWSARIVGDPVHLLEEN